MSRLEIFPQSVTLYPGDKQVFTARTVPPPPMWALTTSGLVVPDYSLKLEPGTDSFCEGVGAHRLYSGIGVVEWIIDDNCKPTSTGSLQWSAYVQGTSTLFRYLVIIGSSNIVIKDENGTTIDTLAITAVSSDVFRLQLASGFRLYRNGTLIHELTSLGEDVVYPMAYTSALIKPVVGVSPTIHRPDLYGDWRLYPIVDFTAPAEGSIDDVVAGLSVEYSDGQIPGTYTLIAQIEATADPDNRQYAEATIIIPPLSVLGDTAITLQPSEVVTFKTNYDAAQNILVSWSVISGSGSFVGAEFTAGTSPGTTVVRGVASGSAQFVEVTITVPAVITTDKDAAGPGELVTFTTNMSGTKTWSATHGTSSGSGSSFGWTAPSQTGITPKVTVTNGTVTQNYLIPVLEIFPVDAHAPIDWDRKKTVLISEAEDRTRDSRVKDAGGLPFEAFELNFKNRDVDELEDVHEFWDEHYPGKAFIYLDKYRGIRLVMYFDSDIRHSVLTDCSIDFSFRIKEGRGGRQV